MNKKLKNLWFQKYFNPFFKCSNEVFKVNFLLLWYGSIKNIAKINPNIIKSIDIIAGNLGFKENKYGPTINVNAIEIFVIIKRWLETFWCSFPLLSFFNVSYNNALLVPELKLTPPQ